MNKFKIKRPESQIWNYVSANSIYEAAQEYAVSDMEDCSEVIYEVSEDGKALISKVIVYMEATYSAYDVSDLD